MFNNRLKIILYAQDVKKANEFWQSLGFFQISFDEIDGSFVAELAVSETSETHLVIYDRQFVETNSSETVEPSPALIFSSDDVLKLYKKLKGENVQVGEIAQIGEEYVFNFVDLDGNYFVVSGQ
ncbi:VOC family protein [Candidatus Enterococcus ferrettii]|uniref:Lactoylglutathione lyase n=1 Tax=Candidatus Enterococcus ferrettii TaxID=2815324 RepID=A0ABV0ETD7_9ENTE|nr:VOC family protein [Enterococcus sp. 665A]MBO1340955.1 VOC family protein [Enterococcus sp. 665A]